MASAGHCFVLLCIAGLTATCRAANSVRSAESGNEISAQVGSPAASSDTSAQQVANLSSPCAPGWKLFAAVTPNQCLLWLKGSGADGLTAGCSSYSASIFVLDNPSYLPPLQSLLNSEPWYDDELNAVPVLLGARFADGRWTPSDFASGLSKAISLSDPPCTGTSTSCPDKCLILVMNHDSLAFDVESCLSPFKQTICSATLKQ